MNISAMAVRAMLLCTLIILCASVSSMFTHAGVSSPYLIEIEYEDVLFYGRGSMESEDTWQPERIEARSRWSFLIREHGVSEDAFQPLDLKVTTETPIAVNEYYLPETLQVQTPNYLWHYPNDSTEITFMMEPLVSVNPGIRITRSARPTVLPPGLSTVWFEVTLEALRNATINEREMKNAGGWISIDIPEFYREMGIELDEYITDHGFGFDRLAPREKLTFEVGIRLSNTSGQSVRVDPIVDINLHEQPLLWNPNYDYVVLSDTFSTIMTGIADEELHLEFSTATPVDWSLSRGIGHGQIWLYWMGAVLHNNE